MLQLIGWLMCAYMVVKAAELIGHGQEAKVDGSKAVYWAGAALSVLVALIFVLLINGQVNSSGNPDLSAAERAADDAAAEAAVANLEALADSQPVELENSATSGSTSLIDAQANLLEADAGSDELDASADEALSAADNAIENADRAIGE